MVAVFYGAGGKFPEVPVDEGVSYGAVAFPETRNPKLETRNPKPETLP